MSEEISTFELAKQFEEKRNADLFEQEKETTAVVVTEPKDETEMVQSALIKAGMQANKLKDVIDIGVTGKALQKDGVIETLTDKKEQELTEDATAKLEEAKAGRSAKEKDRIDAEIETAKAYFNAHEEVLRYAFCNKPMTVPYMKVMAVVGTIVMYIFKYGLFLPFFVAGKLLEMIVEIVGSVGGAIKKEALKIVVGVIVVIFLIAIGIGCYLGIPLLLRY